LRPIHSPVQRPHHPIVVAGIETALPGMHPLGVGMGHKV
jgi:hypothetical protein